MRLQRIDRGRTNLAPAAERTSLCCPFAHTARLGLGKGGSGAHTVAAHISGSAVGAQTVPWMMPQPAAVQTEERAKNVCEVARRDGNAAVKTHRIRLAPDAAAAPTVMADLTRTDNFRLRVALRRSACQTQCRYSYTLQSPQHEYLCNSDLASVSATTMSATTLAVPGPDPTLVKLPARLPSTTKPATKTSPPAHISLLAGAVAGGVEASVTYPFEFAKTRAQLYAGGSKNPFTVIAQVARSDGVGAIYTGCSTLIMGNALKAGVRFLSFDSIRTRLADERGVLSPARGVLAGMLAGTVESVVALTPTERVKTALIDDAKGQRQYRGGFHAAKSILAAQGISGLYRGLLSTTMKQSATSAVRMGSYNVLKELSRRQNLAQNSATTFTIGAIAGTITVYATQPFDTIKTRSQSAKGATTGEAVRSVLKETGVRGFWRGSTMRLGRLVFSGGIVFTVYEKIVAVLHKPN